jgi:hypothetical protein
MKTTTRATQDGELRKAIRQRGAETKREFNRRRLQKLAEKLGTFDSVMTQEELRRMREEP